MTTSWDLSVLIGIPIVLALVVASVICVLAAWKTDGDDLWVGAAIIIGGATLIIGAIFAACTFPWTPAYHQWRPVSGVVQKIDSRMIADGNSMSQRFVAQINGTLYGIDDTRAATVKVGDNIQLKCIRQWNYSAADGYVCKWVG